MSFKHKPRINKPKIEQQ